MKEFVFILTNTLKFYISKSWCQTLGTGETFSWNHMF